MAIDEQGRVFNSSLNELPHETDKDGHKVINYRGMKYYVINLMLDHFFPKTKSDEYPEFLDGDKTNCSAVNIVVKKQNAIDSTSQDDHYNDWLRKFYKEQPERYMKLAKMDELDQKMVAGSADIATEKKKQAEASIPKAPEEPIGLPVKKPSFYTLESLRKNHPQSLDKGQYDQLMADIINSGMTGSETVDLMRQAEITRNGKDPHLMHVNYLKKTGLIE